MLLCNLCFKQIVKSQLDACMRRASWMLKNELPSQTSMRFQFKRRLYLASSFFSSDPSTDNINSKGESIEDRLTPSEWKKPFQLPNPGLDWAFLLSEESEAPIKANIDQRKGIGNIQKVKTLWSQFSNEREEEKKEKLGKEILAEALDIPNMSHPDTPIGDESEAVNVEVVGDMKMKFDSPPRNVSEVGAHALRMLREENLTFSTGSKTYYLEADLARLERALVAYTLDHLLGKGFELVSVPDLLHAGVIDSCGFKTTSDRSQVYQLHPDCLDGACLAGTAEMSLAGYFMNEVIPIEQLPKRIVAASRCYRAEAAENAAEKGLYRVHHFTKVEMFGLTACEDGEESNNLLHEFLNIERELFTNLGLHFRILNMPTQELGAPAHRKYDVEAWMYGKNIWGEISSCSNCTDFQARRLNIQYLSSSSDELKYVHTINGTACAVPRMITAIVEQNQQKKKKLDLPEVLHPYMDGQTHLQGTGKRSTSTYIKTLRKV